MKNNLYNIFMRGIGNAHNTHDIFWETTDFEFDHLIGLHNSLNIRKTIIKDLNVYRTKSVDSNSRILIYNFKNEFFEILEIRYKYIEEFTYTDIIDNEDMFFVNFDNKTKKLTFYIFCDHLSRIDLCKVRLGLILGYYQYFKQKNINNEFVDFMNYLITNNSHRPLNSTNVFESIVKESQKYILPIGLFN